jgi:hypothetical protein
MHHPEAVNIADSSRQTEIAERFLGGFLIFDFTHEKSPESTDPPGQACR